MIVDLAVAQEVEQPFDFFIGDGLAQADVVDVGDGDEHGRVIRHDPQVKETAGGAQNCFFFNAFDDTEPVVRVDDLVADLKCHVSPVAGRLWKDRSRGHSARSGRPESRRAPEAAPTSIAHMPHMHQRIWAKKRCFSTVRPVPLPVQPGRCRKSRRGRVGKLQILRDLS